MGERSSFPIPFFFSHHEYPLKCLALHLVLYRVYTQSGLPSNRYRVAIMLQDTWTASDTTIYLL